MSNYNIADKYDENHEYSLKELIHELISEKYGEVKKGIVFRNKYHEFLDKIKSRNNSGVYDHLMDIVGFDPLKNAQDNVNNRELHNTLKIIKLMYYLEKQEQSDMSIQSPKIRLKDILSNPSLEYLNTIYSANNTYGNILENFDRDICSLVDDFQSRNEWWEISDYCWYLEFENILSKVMLCDDSKYIMYELRRIESYLEHSIMTLFDQIQDEVKDKHEGVAETLYTILSAHIVKCYENNLFEELKAPKCPDVSFCEDFADIFQKTLNMENIVKIREVICNSNTINDVSYKADANKVAAKLILSEMTYNENNKRYFDFAFKHYTTILDWWSTNHNPVNVENGDFTYGHFISIIQELLSINSNNEKITNKFFGYKFFLRKLNVSLNVSIRKPNEAAPLAVMIILNNIENRMIANAERYDILLKKMNIENLIFQIKQRIFSFKDQQVISTINTFIYKLVSREIIDDKQAHNVIVKIIEQTQIMLKNEYCHFDFTYEDDRAKRAALNMAKEIIITNSPFSPISELFCNAVMKVQDFRTDELTDITIRCPITFTYNNHVEYLNPNVATQTYYAIFKISNASKIIFFKDFLPKSE